LGAVEKAGVAWPFELERDFHILNDLAGMDLEGDRDIPLDRGLKEDELVRVRGLDCDRVVS
jgi:hypothetical protein